MEFYLLWTLIRLNFLSINRFERKKNIELAISAFARLFTSQSVLVDGGNSMEFTLTIAGEFL